MHDPIIVINKNNLSRVRIAPHAFAACCVGKMMFHAASSALEIVVNLVRIPLQL